jgi:hypothetical protein
MLKTILDKAGKHPRYCTAAKVSKIKQENMREKL